MRRSNSFSNLSVSWKYLYNDNRRALLSVIQFSMKDTNKWIFYQDCKICFIEIQNTLLIVEIIYLLTFKHDIHILIILYIVHKSVMVTCIILRLVIKKNAFGISSMIHIIRIYIFCTCTCMT